MRATTTRDRGYRDGIEERPLLQGLRGLSPGSATSVQQAYVEGWLEGRAARMRIADRAAVEVAGQVISELRFGDRSVAPQGPAAPGVEVNRSVALAKRLGRIWALADSGLDTDPFTLSAPGVADFVHALRAIRSLAMAYAGENLPARDLTSDDVPDPADTPRDAARLAEEEARDPDDDEGMAMGKSRGW